MTGPAARARQGEHDGDEAAGALEDAHAFVVDRQAARR